MMNTAIFHYFHKIIRSEYFRNSMTKVHFMNRIMGLRKSLLLVGLMFFLGLSNSQAQFWLENFGDDFGGCANVGQLADGFNTFNGPWTVVNEGVNGGIANVWYVSATTAGGFFPPSCGAGCLTQPALFNQSLHIGTLNNPTADQGATYNGYFSPVGLVTTSKRVESPLINCSGNYNNELEFWFVASPNANDKATLMYSDGITWIPLADLPSSGSGCGPNEFPWDNFQIALPASANDNPNVQIGIRWINNSDGAVASYSVAVDNIRLFAGPAPAAPDVDFEVLNGEDTFCEGLCATMNDLTVFDPLSTGAASATYAWEFPGGNPATSDLQNPTVCYDTPGSKNVTLTVTDNIDESDPVTITDIITVLDCGPDIAITASSFTLCANEECADFTDLSTTNNPGGITSWLWTFTSPTGVETTSINQNPTNVCLNEIGFYDVTLSATDPDRTEEQTFPGYIEIIDCTGPEVDFEADRTVICPGQCIQLTDLSTSPGTIIGWNWDLPGGQAAGETLSDTSTQQNPVVCYDNPGVYDITLVAIDNVEGASAITKTITITVDPCTGPPIVDFVASADSICTGDCVDFTNQSLGLVEDYLWVFQGTADISDATSTEQNPSVICYSQPGTYNVTLTISNSNNQVDSETRTDFIVVEQCISNPVPRIEISADTICAGQCVTYTDASTGIGVSSWQWNFQGAVSGSNSSTLQNPGSICYNNPGTFDVSLSIEGTGGDSVRVFQDVITVINSPECRPTIEVFAPDTVCAGDCVEFSAVFIDADSVRWTFQGGDPASSTAFNPGIVCFEEEGEYIVLVEAWNPAGGAQPIVLDLFVGERPPLNAGPDRTINSGAVITLTGSLGNQPSTGSFLWQPFELVDDFTAQTVTTSPDETTKYIVYYKEPGSCTAIDTVTVMVNFVAAVGVPTAFSPNGDGQNDVLRVLGQGITRMDFKVFNRYGQLVFQTTNQSVGWDGLHNGKELNPGTFVYTLEVTFADKPLSEVYTGNVTLVK